MCVRVFVLFLALALCRLSCRSVLAFQFARICRLSIHSICERAVLKIKLFLKMSIIHVVCITNLILFISLLLFCFVSFLRSLLFFANAAPLLSFIRHNVVRCAVAIVVVVFILFIFICFRFSFRLSLFHSLASS